MRLLQRYIFAELLRVFAFVLSILTVLLVFVGVFREVSDKGLGPLQVLQILPYVVPSLLPFTIPATMLLSVCVVYGRMAGDQEITAAKAAGISVISLLWPSFFFGGVLSVCTLLLTDQAIPWSEANIRRVVTAAMEDILLDVLRSQHQTTDWSQGVTISVKDVRGKKLIKPTFRYAPAGKPPLTANAQEAELHFDFEKQHVLLKLVRAQVDVPGQGPAWFEEFVQPFPLPLGSNTTIPRHINVQRIRQKIDTLKTQHADFLQQRSIAAAFALAIGDFDALNGSRMRNYDTLVHNNRHEYLRLWTELHSRFALACSCFLFVLVGSPFAVLQAKRQFLTNFFLCFVPIILLYYPVVLLALNLSKTGTVDASWAMWVGNAVIAVAGVLVLRRAALH